MNDRRRRIAFGGIAALLCAASALAACDPIDGTDPYALWRVHEHPAGAFHFHTLEPPWAPMDASTDERPLLGLDPSEAAPDAGPGADARLEAYYRVGATAAEELEARRASWQASGYTVEAGAPFTNRAGDVGLSLRASDGDLDVVEVLFDSGVGVVVLSLWGDGPFEGEDYALLMKGFEPRPSRSHE